MQQQPFSVRYGPNSGTSGLVTYQRSPTHDDPYYQTTRANLTNQDNTYSLSRNVGSNPELRSTYERLYGNGGPLRLPEIRSAAPPQVRTEPIMLEIPPAMMQQIFASLAQRGFGASKGKPKLASKMAGDQWRSLVDAKAQEAYTDRLGRVFQQRIGDPLARFQHEFPYQAQLRDPNYIRGLYEV